MDKGLLIQKYIKNKLTKEEQRLFDNLLKNDTDFKQEFELHKDLKAVIRNEERISLKKEFQKMDTVKKVSLFSKIIIAASFALLLSVGSYFMFKDNSLNNQELFAINFEPYRNVMHPVVRGEEDLTKIEEAFVYYENGEFTKFIERIESSNYKNKEYNFYIANAYLAKGNSKEALLILEDYLDNKNAKFTTKAYWYLGLVFLKLDQTENAKIAFEKVKNRGDYNLKKTIDLLNNLN